MTRKPTLAAHDVRDLNAYIEHFLNRELAARAATLTPQDRTSAHQYLLEAAWIEAGRYNPQLAKPNPHTGCPTNFAGHLHRRLPWRYTDWLRDHRHNLRRHPDWQPPLSLDHPLATSNHDPDPDAIPSRTPRLDGAIATSQGDPATHRSPDLQRAIDSRHRVDPRILDQPRPGPTQRTRR